jgi:predicted TIM-barrel fold metal-dependent hydrolase
MGFIDADAHVLECEETWDYLDPSEREYKPVTFEIPPSPGQVLPPTQIWLVGDTFARRFPSDGRPGGFGKEYSASATHLLDAAGRIAEMDALGVDVQVLTSTNFIAVEFDDPLAEAAITRSWNRWMADRTAESGGRLRWVMVPPTLTMERSFEELEFAKANGAVGVMIKGIEHGFFLDHPRFHPLYERAEALDLAMIIHTGARREHLEGLPIAGRTPPPPANSVHYLATVMQGFYAVMASNLNQKFPNLRWGFLESGSTWVPAAVHHYERTLSVSNPDSYIQTEQGTSIVIKPLSGRTLMEDHNLYVACETDEDLPYLTSILGDRQLVAGTDFCHNDRGTDPLAHTMIMSRTDISQETARRITDENGRRLFGIPADYTPTAPVSAAADLVGNA